MSEDNKPKYGIAADENTSYVLDGKTYTGDPTPIVEQRRKEEAQERARKIQEGKQAGQQGVMGDSAYGMRPPFTPGHMQNGQPGMPQPGMPQPGGSYPNYPQPGFQPTGQPPMGMYPGLNQPPMRPLPPELPGRKWPITMLVVGLVMMFIVAPILLASSAIYSVSSLVDGKETVTNSNTLTWEHEFSGATIVMVNSDIKDGWKCETNFNGKEAPTFVDDEEEYSSLANDEDDAVFVQLYSINKSGTLDVKCENSQHADAVANNIIVLTGMNFWSIAYGLIGSSVVGIIGLILTIWGIIWLIKRNRLRNDIKYGRF